MINGDKWGIPKYEVSTHGFPNSFFSYVFFLTLDHDGGMQQKLSWKWQQHWKHCFQHEEFQILENANNKTNVIVQNQKSRTCWMILKMIWNQWFDQWFPPNRIHFPMFILPNHVLKKNRSYAPNKGGFRKQNRGDTVHALQCPHVLPWKKTYTKMCKTQF